MDKINALIDKLQELKGNGAPLQELSYYTQLLYAELLCAKNRESASGEAGRKKISVILPAYTPRTSAPEIVKAPESNKVAAPLPASTPSVGINVPRPAPVEEAAVSASSNTLPPRRPAPPLEPAAKRDLNEIMANGQPSLNDRLKQGNPELVERLGKVPVKDLAKAIGINDKFLFVNELFRGDQAMYDRSIKTINECPDHEEASRWIERELRVKLGWADSGTVRQFYELVRRRFSAI